ncbi:Ctr copper transporter [Dillenia turbinata]|uniref:Copper transport protein n=1 Tax=Dillenia turbinata TaxID=194707 RepID=A0AAN8W814_9MAGN
MNTMSMPSDYPPMDSDDMMDMHMSFYWGKRVLILFQNWPNGGLVMYILALLFVFVLAMAVEVLSVSPTIKRGMNSPMIGGLTHAFVCGVRMGLAYMVMLSVMSYNLGIFIVAVVGHAFGAFVVKFRGISARNRGADDGVTPKV